eukprot:6775797-Prymnesium_polylepis.1
MDSQSLARLRRRTLPGQRIEGQSQALRAGNLKRPHPVQASETCDARVPIRVADEPGPVTKAQ